MALALPGGRREEGGHSLIPRVLGPASAAGRPLIVPGLTVCPKRTTLKWQRGASNLATWWGLRVRGSYGLASPRSQQMELSDISAALARLLVKAGGGPVAEEQP
jgi:hypothetical protein